MEIFFTKIFAFFSAKKYYNKLIAISILTSLILILIPDKTKACSTFFLKNGEHFVVGRNLDYYYADYMVTVNKRNVRKTAFQYAGEVVNLPASWFSKYGSISFNMFGREVTADGMNEAGLVISVLILEETEYPVIANKPSISLDNWIQYLLDNFATVEEVIESCSQINIRYNPVDFWRVHIFVTDGNGTNAVLEFINGELVLHTKETLEKTAITNSTYTSSIAYYNGGVQSGNMESSLNRYFNVAKMLDEYNNEDPIDYAYDVLAVCAQRITQRSMVYDISNKRIYLITSGNTNTRYFDLSSFDFSCDQPALIYRETSADVGEISGNFIPYTWQINQDFIGPGWDFMGKTYTEQELIDFSQYPESFSCIPTSINQILNTEKLIKVYPNPVNQFLKVELPFYENDQVHITILNISGQVVYDEIKNNVHENEYLKININSLQNGLHVLTIKSEGSAYEQKFIKVSD
ncbi:MAG: linear amide C-N hydrolase [Bacteroidota bacterium]